MPGRRGSIFRTLSRMPGSDQCSAASHSDTDCALPSFPTSCDIALSRSAAIPRSRNAVAASCRMTPPVPRASAESAIGLKNPSNALRTRSTVMGGCMAPSPAGSGFGTPATRTS